VLSLLARGETEIVGPLRAGDTEATLEAVRAFGASVEETPGGLRVSSPGPSAPAGEVDCRNSGAALRFLTAAAALLDREVRLTGDDSLRRRPMGPLLRALERLGVEVSSRDGLPPVSVRGPIRPGRTALRGDRSSQFLSGLLMAAPLAGGRVEIEVEGELVSRPYVELTEEAMARFGVRTEKTARGWTVTPAEYVPAVHPVPGDWSSAAFLLAGAAVTGGEVTVTGLPWPTAQADARIVPILQAFGARVERGEGSVRVAGAPLGGARVELQDCPDLLPAAAVLGAVAEGETVIARAAHARLKESDRIAAMAAVLRALGCEAEEMRDGLRIRGGAPLTGAEVATRGDHRVVMAAAVAALRARGTTRIDHPRAHAISYPGFLDDLAALRLTPGAE
jgi:3-phosphoshikimate 1-carboxyvinyltransferase